LSSGLHKIVFLVVGIIPIVLGVLLVGTAGIKGFNGTGGEDTQLFQLLTYMMIPVILGGLLAVTTAFRPSRLFALVSGVLLILPGLFLALINPLYGGPVVILGIAAIITRGKMPKK
jgi:hypothetical protein